MIRAIRSTWWVNVPGLLAIAAMVALMAARRPWPRRVPVHFDFYFHSDRWGSPWEIAVFPVLAGMIVLSGLIGSTIWAQHENGKKRFNLTLPLLATPLGAIAGVHFWYWWNVSALASGGNAGGAWAWVGIAAVIIGSSSAMLESFRRAMPRDEEADSNSG